MLNAPQVDTKSGSPLFNKRAWAKARNVLEKILDGNAAHPPGVQFNFESQVGAKLPPVR